MCSADADSPGTTYDAASVGTVVDVVEIERVLTVTVDVSEVWKG